MDLNLIYLDLGLDLDLDVDLHLDLDLRLELVSGFELDLYIGSDFRLTTCDLRLVTKVNKPTTLTPQAQHTYDLSFKVILVT